MLPIPTDPWFYVLGLLATFLIGFSKGAFGGGLAILGVPLLAPVLGPLDAAITTAYLANGLGLIGFMDDLTNRYMGKVNPLLSRALSFIPPLLIALIYPDIFLQAINIAGGFGIVTLFGVLPSIIAMLRTLFLISLL